MTGAYVWDLPTRLFHWFLVICGGGAFVTGEFFPTPDLHWHALFGYGVLGLMLFRLVWGVVGSRTARFSDFVKGPAAIRAYLRGQMPVQAGHNPLGALSVLAFVVVLLVQTLTGLFNSDEILAAGPLAGAVTGGAASLVSEVHEILPKVLLLLVALHLGALAFYAVKKKRRLVPPMVTGRDKELPETLSIQPVSSLRALLVALAATAVVWVATQMLPTWLGWGAASSFN